MPSEAAAEMTGRAESGDSEVRELLDRLVGAEGERGLALGRVASRREVRALLAAEDAAARRFVLAAAAWSPGTLLQDTGTMRWTQLSFAAAERLPVLRQVLALLLERPERFVDEAVELVTGLARAERRTCEPESYLPASEEELGPGFLATAPDPEAAARLARDAAHLKALDEHPLPVAGVVAVAEAAASVSGGAPSDELRRALAELAPRLRAIVSIDREPEHQRALAALERLLAAGR